MKQTAETLLSPELPLLRDVKRATIFESSALKTDQIVCEFSMHELAVSQNFVFLLLSHSQSNFVEVPPHRIESSPWRT